MPHDEKDLDEKDLSPLPKPLASVPGLLPTGLEGAPLCAGEVCAARPGAASRDD